MKNLLIIAALFLVASCTKQETKPVTAVTSDNSVASAVSFTSQYIDTINPKKALQVLKSGGFDCPGSKLFKLQLDVIGSAELTNITLWLNDVKVTATSTIENNLITIVPHNLKLPSGVYNYKVRARIVNGNFQTVLSTAIFTDKYGVPLSVSGLPDYGNVFE